MTFTRAHLLWWHESACAEKPAHKCGGEWSRAGRGGQTNRKAGALGWMFAPRIWNVYRRRFPEQADGERIIKGSQGKHASSPLPTLSLALCSQHPPWLFTITKLWIICYSRQEEKKIKLKKVKGWTVAKKFTPCSSEVDLVFVGIEAYRISLCTRVCTCV